MIDAKNTYQPHQTSNPGPLCTSSKLSTVEEHQHNMDDPGQFARVQFALRLGRMNQRIPPTTAPSRC